MLAPIRPQSDKCDLHEYSWRRLHGRVMAAARIVQNNGCKLPHRSDTEIPVSRLLPSRFPERRRKGARFRQKGRKTRQKHGSEGLILPPGPANYPLAFTGLFMDDDFRKAALAYHRLPRPGKLVGRGHQAHGQSARSGAGLFPGVAAACEAIVADPTQARELTARGNLVAVITNGTAVLGLGNIGPLASKPVMEGKAVLFKKFAGIDVFDLEVDANDIDRFVEVVAALEPTFGGINLEDIKAPECFVIEKKLRERMKIPVFHDDQHGTAIVCAAAIRNGLVLQGKTAVGREAGDQRRRRRRAGLRGPAGGDGPAHRQCHPHRHQGRGAQGPRRRDAAQHGALRPARPTPAPWAMCWSAPTCSWAFPRPMCSSPNGCR